MEREHHVRQLLFQRRYQIGSLRNLKSADKAPQIFGAVV